LRPQPNRGAAVSAVIHGRDAHATMFSAPREEVTGRDSIFFSDCAEKKWPFGQR